MEIIYPGKPGALLNIACGYTLILITIWSTRALQRELFWIDVAFFLSVAVLALYHSPLSNMTMGNTTTTNANAILGAASFEARSLTAETASQMSRASGARSRVAPHAFVRFFRQRFRSAPSRSSAASVFHRGDQSGNHCRGCGVVGLGSSWHIAPAVRQTKRYPPRRYVSDVGRGAAVDPAVVFLRAHGTRDSNAACWPALPLRLCLVWPICPTRFSLR